MTAMPLNTRMGLSDERLDSLKADVASEVPWYAAKFAPHLLEVIERNLARAFARDIEWWRERYDWTLGQWFRELS